MHSKGKRDGKSISCHLAQLQKFQFLFFISNLLKDGHCLTFFATWDLYIWNLPGCNLFDNNGEIHLFSSSVLEVIKDLESFLLVSHIVSDGKSFKREGKGHPGWILTLSFPFFSHSLFLFLKSTPRLALSGTRVYAFCPEIKGGMFTITATVLTTSFTTAELVFGVGIALLFPLGPVGSVHFIVSGLLPLSREASIKLLLQLRHLRRIFWITHYEMCTRFEEMSTFLFFWWLKCVRVKETEQNKGLQGVYGDVLKWYLSAIWGWLCILKEYLPL